MTAISVIITDDHPLVQAGLRSLLEAQPDLEVVAQCRDGRETMAALALRPCNVLLLDLSLPDMSGIDVLRFMRSRYPTVATLVISGYAEREFGIAVLRAGGRGFIGKGADEAELLRAIRSVAHGGRYVGPVLAELLINGMDADADQPAHTVLSEREFQIFCKLAEGLSVTEIATRLCISAKTVSTYRARVLNKMGMKSNADMTTYAVRNALVQ